MDFQLELIEQKLKVEFDTDFVQIIMTEVDGEHAAAININGGLVIIVRTDSVHIIKNCLLTISALGYLARLEDHVTKLDRNYFEKVG